MPYLPLLIPDIPSHRLQNVTTFYTSEKIFVKIKNTVLPSNRGEIPLKNEKEDA